MGKKKSLKLLPSLFKQKNHPWQQFLPSCGHPKTISFRVKDEDDEIYKTVNSVFFEPSESNIIIETPKSWFTTSSESASFSTESAEECDGESLETLVHGVKSERLFFQPGDTSSILEEAKANGFPFKESVVLAMESEDPYEDFKRSMEEMVESHGVKDWEGLEELLGWYLKVNGKNNHGFIVGAFVDLLISIAAAPSSSTTNSSNNNNSCNSDHHHSTSYSSAISSFASSPSLCLCEGHNNEITELDQQQLQQHQDIRDTLAS